MEYGVQNNVTAKVKTFKTDDVAVSQTWRYSSPYYKSYTYIAYIEVVQIKYL